MSDLTNIDQIAVVLSQLVQNYNELAQNWFDIFYNPYPKDITLKFFDTDGNLQIYTLPNRAKDMSYLYHGEGDPEGVISAPTGALYQDTVNGRIYVKMATEGTEGVSIHNWRWLMSLNEVYMSGSTIPDDTVVASVGTLYMNEATGYLYSKTPDGWRQVGGSGFAEIPWVEAELAKLRTDIEAMRIDIEGGVVHRTEDETIDGNKTFNGATAFNNNCTFGGENTFSKKNTFNAGNVFNGDNTFKGSTVLDGTVEVNKVATFKEVIMGTAYRALSADIAEYYEGDDDFKAGTLVQFGGDKEITVAKMQVNAVVSSKPAYILNDNEIMEHPTLIALSGRIPVRVVGKVHKFDKIVLSDIEGVAKVDNSCYNVIGRALEENLDDGEKLVECVVKIQL